MNELDPIAYRLERRPVPGIGESIQHTYLVLLMVLHRVMNKVRTDKAGAPGYEHTCHVHASYGSDPPRGPGPSRGRSAVDEAADWLAPIRRDHVPLPRLRYRWPPGPRSSSRSGYSGSRCRTSCS